MESGIFVKARARQLKLRLATIVATAITVVFVSLVCERVNPLPHQVVASKQAISL